MTDPTGLGTVLGIWAHPDDEAFLSAGLMATAVDAGQRVVAVSATAGDAGGDARRRRAELARALAAVGVVEHLVLGYDDGGCDTVPDGEAVDGLVRLVREIEPDTIVTFGPDGFTGHADHRAVSRWVTATVADNRLARRPRVLHATATPRFVARFGDLNDRFAVFDPGLPALTEPADLALHLELAPRALARKLAALEAHRSQTAALIVALGRERLAAWWGSESFAAGDLQELTTSSPRTGGRVPSVFGS